MYRIGERENFVIWSNLTFGAALLARSLAECHKNTAVDEVWQLNLLNTGFPRRHSCVQSEVWKGRTCADRNRDECMPSLREA